MAASKVACWVGSTVVWKAVRLAENLAAALAVDWAVEKVGSMVAWRAACWAGSKVVLRAANLVGWMAVLMAELWAEQRAALMVAESAVSLAVLTVGAMAVK